MNWNPKISGTWHLNGVWQPIGPNGPNWGSSKFAQSLSAARTTGTTGQGLTGYQHDVRPAGGSKAKGTKGKKASKGAKGSGHKASGHKKGSKGKAAKSAVPAAYVGYAQYGPKHGKE